MMVDDWEYTESDVIFGGTKYQPLTEGTVLGRVHVVLYVIHNPIQSNHLKLRYILIRLSRSCGMIEQGQRCRCQPRDYTRHDSDLRVGTERHSDRGGIGYLAVTDTIVPCGIAEPESQVSQYRRTRHHFGTVLQYSCRLSLWW